MTYVFPRNQSGMTLAEVLVATFLISIGLMALLAAAPIGIGGMETGRQQSTAVYLAQDKMERIKSWSLSSSPNPVQQGFGTILPASTCFAAGQGACATENYGTIAGYANYRRVVTALPDPGTPAPPNHTRTRVTVQVFWTPSGDNAQTTERQVSMSTVVALHQ
jgi:prepilin-type N-terminal cleavage/methylation domain-containing protein